MTSAAGTARGTSSPFYKKGLRHHPCWSSAFVWNELELQFFVMLRASVLPTPCWNRRRRKRHSNQPAEPNISAMDDFVKDTASEIGGSHQVYQQTPNCFIEFEGNQIHGICPFSGTRCALQEIVGGLEHLTTSSSKRTDQEVAANTDLSDLQDLSDLEDGALRDRLR